jgi:hypothetical protein
MQRVTVCRWRCDSSSRLFLISRALVRILPRKNWLVPFLTCPGNDTRLVPDCLQVLTRYLVEPSHEQQSYNCECIIQDFPQPMRYLRAKIIQELMTTERDYVSLLQNLVEVPRRLTSFKLFLIQGFLEQTRRRAELFPAERVAAIFGNLESIRALHCKLLRELELAFNEKMPENSVVGTCFLRNVRPPFFDSRFSTFCSNPVSRSTLNTVTIDRSPVPNLRRLCSSRSTFSFSR